MSVCIKYKEKKVPLVLTHYNSQEITSSQRLPKLEIQLSNPNLDEEWESQWTLLDTWKHDHLGSHLT